jgi:molybdopterin/thiamine biosynthesis adenylyltransferase
MSTVSDEKTALPESEYCYDLPGIIMIIRVKGHLPRASHDKTDDSMPGQNYPPRYLRQIPLIGEEGQDRLARAEVCICGAGGLGSPAALYLAAAGVGTIHLVDGDKVEESNLNRQILHRTATIGHEKVSSARELILALNPGIRVRSSPDWIGEGNAAALIGQADIVIDALDNFEARYVLNREARRVAVPLVHGAVSGFAGQATTVLPSSGPCLQCIIPHPPPGEVHHVLGAVAGVIGSIQALEAIKYLTGLGELLSGKMLLWDGMRCECDLLTLERDPLCRICGDGQESD